MLILSLSFTELLPLSPQIELICQRKESALHLKRSIFPSKRKILSFIFLRIKIERSIVIIRSHVCLSSVVYLFCYLPRLSHLTELLHGAGWGDDSRWTLSPFIHVNSTNCWRNFSGWSSFWWLSLLRRPFFGINHLNVINSTSFNSLTPTSPKGQTTIILDASFTISTSLSSWMNAIILSSASTWFIICFYHLWMFMLSSYFNKIIFLVFHILVVLLFCLNKSMIKILVEVGIKNMRWSSTSKSLSWRRRPWISFTLFPLFFLYPAILVSLKHRPERWISFQKFML